MSSSLRTETFPAGGIIVIPDTANFLMLVETPSPVNVRFTRDGSFSEANGVKAGFLKALVRPWDRVTLAGPPGSSVSFFVGFEEVSEDQTDYRRTVGVFEPQISSVLAAAPPDLDVGATAGPVLLAAANPSRSKVTVGLLDSATVGVRVSNAAVTANSGVPMRGGQSWPYEGTGPVYAIREGAGLAQMWVQEELK
jgi:hypothetical protein